MRADEQFIDWGHEYAGCQGRRRPKPRKKRWGLRFLAFVVIDVVVTAAVTYFWMEPIGAMAAQVFGPPAQKAGAAETELPEQPQGQPPKGLFADAGTGTVLPVAAVLQNPQLPNGCEATSLAAALAYHGYQVDKALLAYDYIPRAELERSGETLYGADPNTAYTGDPATREGFYCFAGPVAAGANAFLAQQGSALVCRDVSGIGMAEMEGHVQAGSPVILWVTLDFGQEVAYLNSHTWTLPDGSLYTPYRNLHCVVLHGFDEVGWHLCDPLAGNIVVEGAQVYQSYLALGAHAAVIE